MDEFIRIDVECALVSLAPREAGITRLYYGIRHKHPITLVEIGRRFGLTRERHDRLGRGR